VFVVAARRVAWPGAGVVIVGRRRPAPRVTATLFATKNVRKRRGCSRRGHLPSTRRPAVLSPTATCPSTSSRAHRAFSNWLARHSRLLRHVSLVARLWLIGVWAWRDARADIDLLTSWPRAGPALRSSPRGHRDPAGREAAAPRPDGTPIALPALNRDC